MNVWKRFNDALKAFGASFRERREAIRREQAAEKGREAFEKAFGLPFDEAVRRCLMRELPSLVPQFLPEILRDLAAGDAAVAQSNAPFVACLGTVGAFWGDAPEVDASTAAFHARAAWDGTKYTVTMLEGTAQVVRHTVRTVSGGTWTVTSDHPTLYVWLKWTRGDGSDTTGNNKWEVKDSESEPTMNGDLNVPLFKFTFGANGTGELVQYVEGSVMLHWTVNALDVDSAV